MRLTYSFWAALCLSLAGCSSSSPGGGIESHPSPSTGDDAGLPGDGDEGDGDEGDGDEGDGDVGDGDGDANSPDGGFEECAASRVEAERQLRPVDVIWVIDNSGSMDEEACYVQTNMNNCAANIAGAGIDNYRVVVMTKTGWVNVPNPLGSDATHFLFVDEDVQSDEPFGDLVARFDAYGSFLQKDAITHFVVVTDDESAMPAPDFLMQMREKLGKEEFFVHAIASEVVKSCIVPGVCLDVPCGDLFGQRAANIGAQYYAAAGSTQGLTFSICTQDWSSLFTTLSEKVSTSAPIPCELLVPKAMNGMSLDPDLVNVVFTAQGEAMGAPIPRVPDAGGCATSSAWYYDNPAAPEKIVLCPTACTAAEGGGAIDIALGCATVVVR